MLYLSGGLNMSDMKNKSETIYKTLSKYKKILEKKGYNVLYIGLYGSQNYLADNKESDFDAKAIISLSVEDLLKKNTVSEIFEFEGKGQVEIKDIISYTKLVEKGNHSFLEPIETNYFIGNKFLRSLYLKKSTPNLRGVLGNMQNKYDNLKHRHPSRKNIIDRYGYDPKQLHHLLRLYLLLEENLNMSSEEQLSFLPTPKWINQIKNAPSELKLEEAELLALKYLNDAKHLLVSHKYDHKEPDILSDLEDFIAMSMFKQYFKSRPTKHFEQNRTFNNNIPKRHLKMFPELEKLKNRDISYLIYSELEIWDYDDK